MKLQLFAPDGTDFAQLSTPSAYAEDPAWSPGGSRILFGRDLAIFSATPDGESVTLIKQHAAVPAWSPDGSRIAFASADSSEIDPDLYTMRSDGSDVRKLVDLPGWDWSPSWSPDGSTIAFTRRPRMGDPPSYSYGGENVYAVPATGGEPVQLTESGSDSDPAWSPDGSTIVFQSDRLSVAPTSAPDLYVMNADGSNERQLTSIGCLQCGPDWASLPSHPQPPAPPAADPAGPMPRSEQRPEPPLSQAFLALSMTRTRFAPRSSVRIHFWAAVAGKVRFTILRALPPLPVSICRRRPNACRTVRQVERRAREGLNRISLRSLFGGTFRPGRYWLRLSSPSGPTHAGLAFHVLRPRDGSQRRG